MLFQNIKISYFNFENIELCYITNAKWSTANFRYAA